MEGAWEEPRAERDAAAGGASAGLGARFHPRSSQICSREAGVAGRRGGEGGRELSCGPPPGGECYSPEFGCSPHQGAAAHLSPFPQMRGESGVDLWIQIARVEDGK